MKRQDDLSRRSTKHLDVTEGTSQDGEKRKVSSELRSFLDWDAELTNQITTLMQKIFPNISKSEAKFMEISGSGFVWLPACVLLYFMHPLVPKQLPVNLTMAFIFDIIIVGSLKAFARRRRPPTKNPDFFKSIGPDQYSFPSGHASRTVLLAFTFTQIYPIFDIGYLNFVASILLWVWSFSVCFSRLLNGRHYLFDVLVGVLLGFFEGLVVSYLWMSPERAENLLSLFSDEAPEI